MSDLQVDDRRSAEEESCGRYQLLRKLATGGMGQVFLASLTGAGGFEKRVAVKRLLPHLAEDERFVAMFLNEARIAARLAHPNICNVYEVGESGGSYYIAMEYLDGETCSQLVRRVGGALPPGLTVGILKQAAEGLHAAHELRDDDGMSLGVIHRDVTPSNIFVCKSGVVKILDFGVAKARDALVKTQAGTLKGKFGYMSPEHLKAIELDRRSDIFSLGIVAHEMLTGQRLFRRDSLYRTTMAILEEPIPPLADFGVSDALSVVIARALSRDRDHRYSTSIEFAEAITRTVGRCWTSNEIREYLTDLESNSNESARFDSYPGSTHGGHAEVEDVKRGNLPIRSDVPNTIPTPSTPPVSSRQQMGPGHQAAYPGPTPFGSPSYGAARYGAAAHMPGGAGGPSGFVQIDPELTQPPPRLFLRNLLGILVIGLGLLLVSVIAYYAAL